MADRVEWRMGSRVRLRWAVAIAVTVLAGFGVYYLTPDLSPRPELGRLVTVGWLVVLGAGVVIGVLAWAGSASGLARRYGDAELELETVPASLGGRLVGRIRAEASLAPDQALNLILQCEARELGGGESGGGSWVKWESEQLLTLADVEQRGGELFVPVDLPVPGDQPPTGKDRRNEYSWRLDLSLEPRGSYAPRFSFPVLRTAESPPEPEAEQEPTIGIVGALDKVSQLVAHARDGSLAAAAATWHRDPPTERPPHARVEVLPRPAGGVEVVLPRTRAAVGFSLWFVLTLPLWIILPAWGFAELRPIISPPATAYLLYLGIGFGVPLLISGLAVHSLAWQTRRLQVGPDGVIVKRRLGRRTHPAGEYTTAAALGSTHQGWSVHLEKTETALLGRLHVAALRTQAEARWLTAELRQALGVETRSPDR